MADSENSSLASDDDLKDRKLTEGESKAKNEENGTGKDEEDDEDEVEIDENRYERDGFVVSDDEASLSSDSDAEKKKSKRKRKRLKKRKPQLDEDDLQLIKENLNKEAGIEEEEDSQTNEEKERKRFKNDRDKRERVGSIDSDGMDEFIVDSNNNKEHGISAEGSNLAGSSYKRSSKLNDKYSAEMEFTEERNKEYASLFVYDKEDYEKIEQQPVQQIDDDDEQEELDKDNEYELLKTKFGEAKLADNYLLKEDRNILKYDIPERIQLHETKLSIDLNYSLKRNIIQRGEFYLRFMSSKISNMNDLKTSIYQQREQQAKWVYYHFLQYKSCISQLQSKTKLSMSDFEDIRYSLIRLLKYMQVDCLEEGYIYQYKLREICSLNLTLRDLFKIKELSYQYLKIILKRDNLLNQIDVILSTDIPDQSQLLLLTQGQDKVPESISQSETDGLNSEKNEEIDRIFGDLEENEIPVSSDIKNKSIDIETQCLPNNLVKIESDLSLSSDVYKDRLKESLINLEEDVTVEDLDNLNKYIIFKYGTKKQNAWRIEQQEIKRKEDEEKKDFEEKIAQEKDNEGKDDLFGNDSDSEDEKEPQNGNGKAVKNRVYQTKQRKVRRKRQNVSFYEITEQSKSNLLTTLLNTICFIPFISKQLLISANNESDTSLSVYISNTELIEQPFKLISSVLYDLKSYLNSSRQSVTELNSLFTIIFNILGKEFEMNKEFNIYINNKIEQYSQLSTQPTELFQYILPDYSNKYITLSHVDRKPINLFFKSKNDRETDDVDMEVENEPEDEEKARLGAIDYLLILKAEEEKLLKITFNENQLKESIQRDLEYTMLSTKGYDYLVELTENKENEVSDTNTLCSELDKEGYLWDSIRLKFINLFCTKYLKPKLNQRIRRVFKKRSHTNVEDYLFNKISSKFYKYSIHLPYKTLQDLSSSDEDGDRSSRDKFIPDIIKVSKYSPNLKILSIILSDSRYDYEAINSSINNNSKLVRNLEEKLYNVSICVLVDGRGNKIYSKYLPSLIEMDKLKNILYELINTLRPYFIVFNTNHGSKSRHLFKTLQDWMLMFLDKLKQHDHDRNREHFDSGTEIEKAVKNEYKIFIPRTSDVSISTIIAQTQYLKLKNTSKHVVLNELKAFSQAMFLIDPMLEISKLYKDTLASPSTLRNTSQKNPILSLIIDQYQELLPSESIKSVFHQSLLSYVALNGVDLNYVLSLYSNTSHLEDSVSLLRFVPGLGVRKSKYLLNEIRNKTATLQAVNRKEIKEILKCNSLSVASLKSSRRSYDKDNLPRGMIDLDMLCSKLEITSYYDTEELIKETALFPSCVYENCIGFMKITKIEAQDVGETEKQYFYKHVNYFDNTRIHPKDYKLASLLCWLSDEESKDKAIPKFIDNKISTSLAKKVIASRKSASDSFKKRKQKQKKQRHNTDMELDEDRNIDVIEDSEDDEVEDEDIEPISAAAESSEDLDRDDIDFDKDLLIVLNKVIKKSDALIENNIKLEDNHLLERNSNSRLINYKRNQYYSPFVQKMFDALCFEKDAEEIERKVRGYVAQKLDLYSDAFENLNLFDIASTFFPVSETSLSSTDEKKKDLYYKVINFILIIEELRLPYLEVKGYCEVDNSTSLFYKFITNTSSFQPLKLYSLLSGQIIEFSYRGIELKLNNGIFSTVPLEHISAGSEIVNKRNIESVENQIEKYCLNKLNLKVNDVINVWLIEISININKLITTLNEEYVIDRVKDEFDKDLTYTPFAPFERYIQSVNKEKNILKKRENQRENAVELTIRDLESELTNAENNSDFHEDEEERRIVHSNFKIFKTVQEVKSSINSLGKGEYFFKDNKKSINYLNVYWRLPLSTTLPRYNHFLIRESKKNSLLSNELGKELRIISQDKNDSKQVYEDMDDIEANFIHPINEFILDITKDKKHFLSNIMISQTTFSSSQSRDRSRGKDTDEERESIDKIKSIFNKEKSENRKIIPYYIVADNKKSTLFHFVFQPSRSIHRISFIIKPEGYIVNLGSGRPGERGRGSEDGKNVFKSYNDLIKYMKQSIVTKMKAMRSRNRPDHSHHYGYSERRGHGSSHGYSGQAGSAGRYNNGHGGYGGSGNRYQQNPAYSRSHHSHRDYESYRPNPSYRR